MFVGVGASQSACTLVHHVALPRGAAVPDWNPPTWCSNLFLSYPGRPWYAFLPLARPPYLLGYEWTGGVSVPVSASILSSAFDKQKPKANMFRNLPSHCRIHPKFACYILFARVSLRCLVASDWGGQLASVASENRPDRLFIFCCNAWVVLEYNFAWGEWLYVLHQSVYKINNQIWIIFLCMLMSSLLCL